MKIAILTLGCKVNSYESGGMSKLLIDAGYEVVMGLEKADIYIINTCAVTQEAEKKSRQMVARALSYNDKAKIFVMGCASQHDKLQFKNKNIIKISGVAGKTDIVSLIQDDKCETYDPTLKFENFETTIQDKTRHYLKIQDGCNNFCSYCLIPYVRGRSRSRSYDDILNELNSLKDIKEIVLTGIDMSSYSYVGGDLSDLILKLSNYNFRLRLGSLEVGIINDKFLNCLLKIKNFCQHFHLSLQSGSDNVLKSMNRHYTTDEYYDKVQLIRKYFPNCSITTDLIVGYPTESDENFNETAKFIQKVNFAKIHIFPYSVRSGTVASKLKDLDYSIKKNRIKSLNLIAQKMENDYVNSCLGKTFSVLIEDNINGKSEGYTENYIKVQMEKSEIGEIKTITLKKENLI